MCHNAYSYGCNGVNGATQVKCKYLKDGECTLVYELDKEGLRRNKPCEEVKKSGKCVYDILESMRP